MRFQRCSESLSRIYSYSRRAKAIVKSNKLRRLYLIYTLILTELVIAVWIICAGFVQDALAVTVMRIVGAAAVVIAPVMIYAFYRWIKKDNQTSSDELEQLMLMKGFALTGFVAITLSPAAALLSFIFDGAAGYIALGYMAVLGGTLKCSVYYYHKKF
ncbi:MAG: hypothetical protein ACM3S4_03695 [Burkholderiales bacterium]